MKRYYLVILLTVMISTDIVRADSKRMEFKLEKGWKFSRDDAAGFSDPDFDDSQWQSVTVPHDWAIYGPFSKDNDMQKVVITQDGQTQEKSHSGRTGGLPFTGTGWYRTKLNIPYDFHGRKVTLLFDGAMSNAQVYVNGKKAGYWPYGYNSFYFDITGLLDLRGDNTVAVRLENLPESSRWYPGAGLYRNVHVVVTDPAHIPVWGTRITTPVVNGDFSKVNIETEINVPEGMAGAEYKLKTTIYSPSGESVPQGEKILSTYDEGVLSQSFIVDSPMLWDTDTPYLYRTVSELYADDNHMDTYETVFGIRSIEVIPDKGFFVNGERKIIKGVCNHHDLGPLGAAVNDAAIRRQIRILKDMGCNAIRTAHNMPAPELVRACDEMGMMVVAETFDEWKMPKCKNGYNLYFDQWAEKDLVNFIRNFRNSASVVMWCIGNEVEEQGTEHGAKVAKYLQDICHREDPTRPVTQGMDNPGAVINNNFAAVMDVPGFNYRPFMYGENYRKLPQRIILGAETTSTVSSRGVYKFPVERGAMVRHEDHQSSSYDVEHCRWSNLPEDDFMMHEDLEYCIGEFVWTGFDYLGEPTPYYTDWPSHSSLFGIVDLAGIPKDRYYLYRSHWNPDVETLHILPHWTFPGRERETTPVFVYTNYPSAELFVNGKSWGVRTKNKKITIEESESDESRASLRRQQRYRLMWTDVVYEPGSVRVVAYDEGGNKAAEKEVHTAGKPYRLEVTADRGEISADGKDLAFINVRLVDKHGNLCPHTDDRIRFDVKGAGKYLCAANGNSVSLESFQDNRMRLFSGQLTAVVQSGQTPGEIYFEASAKGVKSAVIKLECK